MREVTIKKEHYETLIEKTIDNFDNEEKVFDAFYEFLDINGFVEHDKVNLYFPGMMKIAIDKENKTYEELYFAMTSFLSELSDSYVINTNPSEDAINILIYLYVVFYRAFVRINRPYYAYDFSYGLSVEDAYCCLYGFYERKYINENENKPFGKNIDCGSKMYGLMHYFYQFCIKNNLSTIFTKAQNNNKSADHLLYNAQQHGDRSKIESFISTMDNNAFFTLYSSFQNIDGLLDYRVYASMVMKMIERLEPNIQLISEAFRPFFVEMLDYKDEVLELKKSKTPVSFKRYSETSFSTKRKILAILDSEELDNFFGKDTLSLVRDIKNFGSYEAQAALDMNEALFQPSAELIEIGGYCLEVEQRPSIDVNLFDEILREELNSRNEKLYQKMRIEGSKINDNPNSATSIKSYVMRFLRNSQNAGYTYTNQSTMSESDYENLYDKIKQNQEALEILAGFEKRFEDALDNGLTYDDYTFLLCGPVKLIEKVLKLEIYTNYSDVAYQINKHKTTQVCSVSRRLRYVDGKIYDLQLGGLVLTLQNAIVQYNQTNRSQIEMPWFLRNTIENGALLTHDCKFYSEFASNVRNGYFHTHTISTLADGKELYKKVSFWFVECMNYFNPFTPLNREIIPMEEMLGQEFDMVILDVGGVNRQNLQGKIGIYDAVIPRNELGNVNLYSMSGKIVRVIPNVINNNKFVVRLRNN